MDAPYRVEEHRTVANGHGIMRTEYAIHKTGDGVLVRGDDIVLMHRIVDLLNDDVNGKDIHR